MRNLSLTMGNLPVVAPFISIIHFDSRPISRELKGLTRTATLTDDMADRDALTNLQ